MRRNGLLLAAACAAWIGWIGATCAVAQSNGDYGQAEDQIPPYPTHQDRRHGHDRVYPDRGAIVRDLPRGGTVVNYAGVSYRFVGGVWYEPRGPAYIVVAPPIGLIVPALPGFATAVRSRGKSYLYADDVYYRARPDLGGYEVVNDPADNPPVASRPAERGLSENGETAHAPEAATPPSERPQVTPLTGPVAIEAPNPAEAPASVPASRAEIAAHPEIAPSAESAVRTEQTPEEPTRQAKIEPQVPATLSSGAPSAPVLVEPRNATRISALPQNGQGADEQARDRYICYRFAVAQSGFDPLNVEGDSTSADFGQRQTDYERAQAACLEERGYRLR